MFVIVLGIQLLHQEALELEFEKRRVFKKIMIVLLIFAVSQFWEEKRNVRDLIETGMGISLFPLLIWTVHKFLFNIDMR